MRAGFRDSPPLAAEVKAGLPGGAVLLADSALPCGCCFTLNLYDPKSSGIEETVRRRDFKDLE